jgi:hypothetical protein
MADPAAMSDAATATVAGTPAIFPAPITLDRTTYAQSWRVFALRVPPKLCQGVLLALKDHVLRVPRVAAIAKPSDNDAMRIVLLRYFSKRPQALTVAPLGNIDPDLIGDVEAVATRVSSAALSDTIGDDVSALVRAVDSKALVESCVDISYDHWTAEAVLNNLLPKGVTVYVHPFTCQSCAYIRLSTCHRLAL